MNDVNSQEYMICIKNQGQNNEVKDYPLTLLFHLFNTPLAIRLGLQLHTANFGPEDISSWSFLFHHM